MTDSKIIQGAKEALAFAKGDDSKAALHPAMTDSKMPELLLSIERKFGMYGSAYDGPNPARAYTYKHQPANTPAWKLGEALRKSADDQRCGDYIDRGLILLRELEAAGFGVFTLVADETAHPAPVADAELEALVQRAEAIDPVLEVEFDTQMDIERNPYGAREAIEDALHLIRDLTTALRARTAQPVGVRVKPLEWGKERQYAGVTEVMTKCKTYRVTEWPDKSGNVLWFGVAGRPVRIDAPTSSVGITVLKSSAQADYDQRILSALLPEGGA